jgi:hypothetical protein
VAAARPDRGRPGHGAAAVVAAFAVAGSGGSAAPLPVPEVQPQESRPAEAAPPYLRPVSAAQYFENAAWSVEREKWTDPGPEQFMYVETSEMRNPPSIERKRPNGAMVPGKAKYRTTQVWNRIDGAVQASMRNGKLEVRSQSLKEGYWAYLPYSVVAKLTTPEAVKDYADHPEKTNVWIEPTALIGQYVLPPEVRAAIFRYLARLPGMKVNPHAVNLDGRSAIGLGQVLEGYLAQELMFDKQTYALIGERLIAVADHVNRALDATTYTKKGDLFRQVIYRKLIIVDQPGQTTS